MSTKKSKVTAAGSNLKKRMTPRAGRATSDKSREKAIQKRLTLASDHVYWASGIVACCAYVASARLFPEPDRQGIGNDLKGAHVLIEWAGGALIDVLDDELDEE